MSNTEVPAHVSRESIKQEIAGMMHNKLDIALVTGSPDGIKVSAYTWNKLLFMEANLRPNPAVTDSFTLEVFAEYGGEYLVEEQDAAEAGEQAKINHAALVEGAIEVTYDTSKMVRNCVFAKAKQTWMQLDGFPDFEFKPGYLKWLFGHDLDTFLVHPKSVITATVVGEYGDYRFYLRGRESQQRLRERAAEEAAQREAERRAALDPEERELIEKLERLRAAKAVA